VLSMGVRCLADLSCAASGASR